MKYKDNAIQLEDGDLERFKKDGWIINIHASNDNGAYYFNFIGIEFMGVKIGFSSWKDNLSLWIDRNKQIKISSQKELIQALNDLRIMKDKISPLIKGCSIADMICDGNIVIKRIKGAKTP